MKQTLFRGFVAALALALIGAAAAAPPADKQPTVFKENVIFGQTSAGIGSPASARHPSQFGSGTMTASSDKILGVMSLTTTLATADPQVKIDLVRPDGVKKAKLPDVGRLAGAYGLSTSPTQSTPAPAGVALFKTKLSGTNALGGKQIALTSDGTTIAQSKLQIDDGHHGAHDKHFGLIKFAKHGVGGATTMVVVT